jgi:NYN domain/OST-HTH/LOTUS domain
MLISGDSDFTDLVHYLRSRGLFVIGMGVEGPIAKYLVNACDKYDYYDLLHKHEVSNTQTVAEPELKVCCADISEARHLLRQAMHIFGSGWVDGSTLKGKILSLKPDFDERRYGFPRFKDFSSSLAGRRG